MRRRVNPHSMVSILILRYWGSHFFQFFSQSRTEETINHVALLLSRDTLTYPNASSMEKWPLSKTNFPGTRWLG